MMTSKDDKCRMLHLYFNPSLQEIWRDCLDRLNRPSLDADVNHYHKLTRCFSDYVESTYFNMRINATTECPINDDLVCM